MRNKKTYSYFLIYAIIGLIVVLLGFGYTYIAPMAKGTLEVPISVHIHAVFAFTWILLYLLQTFLIHKRNYKLHMSMGMFSIVVLVGFFITLFPATLYGIERDLPEVGEKKYGLTMIGLTSGLWVLGLGLAGLYYRKKPQIHKRLMFLATIVILWPAWGRVRHYFPGVSSDWFQFYIPYGFIIIAWIFEKFTYGKIHRVLLIMGILMILEGSLGFVYPDWEFINNFVKWIFT